MDPAQLLRERERRLVAEYPASHPPKAFDGEDLKSEDPRTVEHWVAVYSELVDFVHSIVGPGCHEGPAAASGGTPDSLPAIELEARVLELHLAYWNDRRAGLRRDPGPGKG